MGKITSSLLANFRHQLRLEHISIVDEVAYEEGIAFFVKNDSIMYWQLDNLRRITPFSVYMAYHEGSKVLVLTILFNS